ncbi:MAG: tRNA guanosine(15) transglycosylase TgtA [Candidatus Heimdallarchaeota archaeon]|nr:tRNA guanosine(15) transglycosylase TgtA [Candidatus Heimdallarchaeota archaeon]
MFSIEKWDGLAKIGKYQVNNREMTTPALFPVVDPSKQEVDISRLKSDFGFDQVITSAYLMSKRLSGLKLEEFPKVHEYLNFDGIIMMDSGAYQVMLYGDIDLGVQETIQLQQQVQPDIGVIMDHPIGFDVSHNEAKSRIETTIRNLQASIPSFGEHINWTLPIQGGKYIDLMATYLQEITKPDVLEHFNFYALGSVVPVMIHQRYDILVDMIALARSRMPVTKPLHLFGAGHPAMFALATFLGCDTFDSAAYILMAKDGRYMTVEGTYQIDQLKELPCSCKICTSITIKELNKMTKQEKTRKLAEHNLYVSNAEIMRIRTAIRYGRLWDLVQQRAAAVPNLAKATRKAVALVTSGFLKDKYNAGIPVFSQTAVRMLRSIDVYKSEVTRIQKACHRVLLTKSNNDLICLGYLMDESIYNKTTQGIMDVERDNLCFLLPPFGIIPVEVFDLYPIGQLSHDLEFHHFPTDFLEKQIIELKSKGMKKITLILPEDWPEDQISLFKKYLDVEIINHSDPMRYIKD